MKSKQLLIEKIKQGKHLTEEVNSLNHLRFSQERVSRLIEILNFHSRNWILGFFRDEFVQDFNELNFSDKLEVAESDKHGMIILLMVISQEPQGLASLISQPIDLQAYIDFVLVLALEKRDISLIPHDNYKLMYEYFVFSEIDVSETLHFSNNDFLTLLFKELLTEQQVLYSNISHNLLVLMDCSIIDSKNKEHADFIERLFIKKEYIHGGIYQILVKAIELSPIFLIQLFKVKLSIDPFTRSTNYSKWLNEENKFQFLAEQFAKINVLDVIQSDEYIEFQNKLEAFNRYCPY